MVDNPIKKFITGLGNIWSYLRVYVYIQLNCHIITVESLMIEVHLPLKQVFGDVNYAWELLECQVKLQTSENVTGEDISHLLQLYMRGVEKMNSMIDIRQSFFKNKVTSLMSRPTVIKSLNKPMSKKNMQAPVIQSSPVKKPDNRIQLQLQQKKRQMQMRIAYGAQQHNPDALKKMLNQHSQKQVHIVNKIHNIVNEHEQRLNKRIRQRKLRTMTAKSRSDIYMNNDTNDTNGFDFQQRKQLMEKKRDEEQFGGNHVLSTPVKKQRPILRRVRSIEPKRSPYYLEPDSPIKRRISVDFTEDKKKKLE